MNRRMFLAGLSAAVVRPTYFFAPRGGWLQHPPRPLYAQTFMPHYGAPPVASSTIRVYYSMAEFVKDFGPDSVRPRAYAERFFKTGVWGYDV